MSDITYNSTKSAIWKYCKELKNQLAKAEKAAGLTPAVVAKAPKMVETQPVRLKARDQLVVTRMEVEAALAAFQSITNVVDDMVVTLESVHNVDFTGPDTLTKLCTEYETVTTGNKTTLGELIEKHQAAISTARADLKAQLTQRRAQLDEDQRVEALVYARETADLREKEDRDRDACNEEVQAIADKGDSDATKLLEDDAAEWSAADKEITELSLGASHVLADADGARKRITSAMTAGTAQGRAIATKSLLSEARVVSAERFVQRTAIQEEIESTNAQVEVASTRITDLTQRITNARSAAIALAQQSVTSKSASGALAAVSEIALKQAASPVKGK